MAPLRNAPVTVLPTLRLGKLSPVVVAEVVAQAWYQQRRQDSQPEPTSTGVLVVNVKGGNLNKTYFFCTVIIVFITIFNHVLVTVSVYSLGTSCSRPSFPEPCKHVLGEPSTHILAAGCSQRFSGYYTSKPGQCQILTQSWWLCAPARSCSLSSRRSRSRLMGRTHHPDHHVSAHNHYPPPCTDKY